MTVQDIKQQIAALTPPEYQEVWSFVVNEEYERRNADRYTAKLVGEMQDKGELSKPDAVTENDVKAGADVPEWKDPGTDHAKMYTYGQVVRYNGKLVRSTHDGLNCWAPGTLGFDGRIWEVVDEPETTETEETSTEQPTAPAFKQPTGGHDAYKQGDRVTYNGAVYESTINSNVWAPDAYPQGWRKL